MSTLSTLSVKEDRIFDPRPLVAAKRARGLSLQDLSNLTGFTRVTVCRVLKGRNMSLRSVRKLCAALGVTEENVILTEPPDSTPTETLAGAGT